MKVPFSLRWALMWAAMTGRLLTVSVGVDPQFGTRYRFELEPRGVRRWLARRERMRAKAEAKREAEQSDRLA